MAIAENSQKYSISHLQGKGAGLNLCQHYMDERFTLNVRSCLILSNDVILFAKQLLTFLAAAVVKTRSQGGRRNEDGASSLRLEVAQCSTGTRVPLVTVMT